MAFFCSFSSSCTLLQMQTLDWQLATCNPGWMWALVWGEKKSPFTPPHPCVDQHWPRSAVRAPGTHTGSLTCSGPQSTFGCSSPRCPHCPQLHKLHLALHWHRWPTLCQSPAPSEALQTSFASTQHVSSSTTTRKSAWFDRSNCYKTIWTNMVWFSRCSFSVWVVPLLCPALVSGFLA